MAHDDESQALSRYMAEMRRHPNLTPERESELLAAWQERGDRRAFDEIVAAHLRLVVRIAHGYRGYGLPLMDIVSEGAVGLVRAVEGFDRTHGTRVSTYAMWWIKANINEYVMRTWSMVHFTGSAAHKKLFFKLRRIKANKGIVGPVSHDDAIAIGTQLGVEPDAVRFMDARMSNYDFSLNTPRISDDERGATHQDTLVDASERHDAALMRADQDDYAKRIVEEAMKGLNPREIDIIRTRVLTDDPLTLEELGQKYGITRERIRQVEAKALRKIEAALRMPGMRPDLAIAA